MTGTHDPLSRAQGTPVYAVGSKLYARCAGCGSMVQINKRLVGSMHLCVPSPTDGQQGGEL